MWQEIQEFLQIHPASLFCLQLVWVRPHQSASFDENEEKLRRNRKLLQVDGKSPSPPSVEGRGTGGRHSCISFMTICRSEGDWEDLLPSVWENGSHMKAWFGRGVWAGEGLGRGCWIKAPPQFKVSVAVTRSSRLDKLLPPPALSGLRTSWCSETSLNECLIWGQSAARRAIIQFSSGTRKKEESRRAWLRLQFFLLSFFSPLNLLKEMFLIARPPQSPFHLQFSLSLLKTRGSRASLFFIFFPSLLAPFNNWCVTFIAEWDAAAAYSGCRSEWGGDGRLVGRRSGLFASFPGGRGGEHERASGRRSRPSARFTGKLEKHCNLLSTSPSSFMESWWLDWCLTFEWGSETNKVDGETFGQRKPFLSAALRVCLTFAAVVVVVVLLFPLHHFLLGELPLPRAALKS